MPTTRSTSICGKAILIPPEPPATIPGDADGAVFAEPWQARAFAIVVALCRDGGVPWDDFRNHLIAEIGAADDEATGYYEHWLTACERLLAERGVVAPETLAAIKADLAAHPPHPTTAKANPVAVDPARS